MAFLLWRIWHFVMLSGNRYDDRQALRRLRYSYARYGGNPRVLFTRFQIEQPYEEWEENIKTHDKEVESVFEAIRGPRPSADGPGHTRMAWDPSKAWPKLTNQKTIYAIKYLNIYCTKKCDIRKR